jgi:hypothetical protein
MKLAASRFMLATVVLLGLLHVALAADVAWRVWSVRGGFDSLDLPRGLVLVEALRAAATLLALGAAVRLAFGRPAWARALGLAVALLAVAHAQFTFPDFPGHLQDAIARGLLDAGVPLTILVLLFGTASWTLWLALGAALRAGALAGGERAGGHASGGPAATAEPAAGGARLAYVPGMESGREGLMRENRVAGADIGVAFRRLSTAAESGGWLRGRIVWPAAAVLALAHLLAPAALGVPLLLVYAAGVGIAVTLLRAAAACEDERQRRRLGWLAVGGVLAVGGFVLGGAAAVVLPDAGWPSYLLLSTTPFAAAAAVGHAAFRPTAGPAAALRRLARGLAVATVALIIFGVADTALASAFTTSRSATVTAAAAAAVALALLRRPLARLEAHLMRSRVQPGGRM